MLGKIISSAIAAAVISLSSSAYAATAVFDFKDSYRGWSAGSHSLSQGNLDLDISSARYRSTGISNTGAIQTTTQDGLGIRGGALDRNSQINGSEIARFHFSEAVRLVSMTFTSNDLGDHFVLYSAPTGGRDFGERESGVTPVSEGEFDFSSLNGNSTYNRIVGRMFGIGTLERSDFSIGSITVDYGTISAVPLPPSILLFGAALMGLGWLSRKQKKG